jgi:hypothetical protein
MSIIGEDRNVLRRNVISGVGQTFQSAMTVAKGRLESLPYTSRVSLAMSD